MNITRISFLALLFALATNFSHASLYPNLNEHQATQRLLTIHNQLSLIHGSLHEEFPEQLMAAMFISENDKVLEIGGNVGRNSCVIGSMLKNSNQLVVAESDFETAVQLVNNRENNRLGFLVENSAISCVLLYQYGWDTTPEYKPGFIPIQTITYTELKNKFGMQFNVLVADCEGALYYILNDDESVLNDVETIIVENDYHNYFHYLNVCTKFMLHGFHLAYNKAGGWGPCYNEFYQVWKKY